MAEEIVSNSESSLVLQTDKEKLLNRLESFKINNLTAAQKEKANSIEKSLKEVFFELCWKFLGVSKEQVKQLPDDELKELGKLIYEKSSWWPGLLIIGALTLIPILGWIVLSESEGKCPSWIYKSSYNKLKAFYGENYFPCKKIKE